MKRAFFRYSAGALSIILGALYACEYPHSTKRLHYRSTPEAELHVFLNHPDKRGPSKGLIVLFHGGGWWTGKPKSLEWQAKFFANAGYTVARPEYRVYGRHRTGINAAVDDAAASLDWLLDGKESVLKHPLQLVLGGSSAGAHLALAASRRSGINPDGLLLLNPVLELTSATPADGYSSGELKLISELSSADREKLSFLREMEDPQSPVLMMFGLEDPLWRAYGTPLTEADRRSGLLTLERFPGATHGFFHSEPLRGLSAEVGLDWLRHLPASSQPPS